VFFSFLIGASRDGIIGSRCATVICCCMLSSPCYCLRRWCRVNPDVDSYQFIFLCFSFCFSILFGASCDGITKSRCATVIPPPYAPPCSLWHCLVQWCRLDMKNFTLVFSLSCPFFRFSVLVGARYDEITGSLCVTLSPPPPPICPLAPRWYCLVRWCRVEVPSLTPYIYIFVFLDFLLSVRSLMRWDHWVEMRDFFFFFFFASSPWYCLAKNLTLVFLWNRAFRVFLFSVRCLMRWGH